MYFRGCFFFGNSSKLLDIFTISFTKKSKKLCKSSYEFLCLRYFSYRLHCRLRTPGP